MRAFAILTHADLVLGTAAKSSVRRAWYLANDEGMIQAHDAARLFPADPKRHTAMSLTTALIALGCNFRGVSDWRARGNRAA